MPNMCIGTLLTKRIWTCIRCECMYVTPCAQLILFLRVANQLHIVFDKQMKESPKQIWRVK